MLATLYSLGTLAAILLASFGFGRPLVRLLKVGDDGVLAACIWGIGLGLGCAAAVLSVAAFAGLLTPLVIGILTIGGCFWGLGEATCAYLALRNPFGVRVKSMDDLPMTATPGPPSLWLQAVAATGFGLVALATFVSALAPPLSTAAVSGALELAKSALLTGAWPTFDRAPASFVTMMYAWALAIDGPVAASLCGWFFGMLLAAATGLLARGLVGRTGGWLAGAIALLVPGISYQMSAPLDDLMMTALATLAFAAWWRGTVECLSPRWFILSGLFLGAALASKAVALVLLLAVAATWVVELARHIEHRREVSYGAACTMAIALVIALPLWLWTIAHGSALVHAEPGAATIVELGPFLIAALPGILISRRLRGLHLIWFTTAGVVLMGLLLVPQSRITTLLVPLLSTIAVWVFFELSRLQARFRRLAGVCLAVTAAIVIAVNIVNVSDRWRVALGIESRSEYLRKRLGVYRACEVASRVLRDDSRLLSQDARGLYFPCLVANDENPQALAAHDSGEVLQTLRQQGFTHLLLCSANADDATAEASPLEHAVTEELAKPEPKQVLPLTEYRFADESGNLAHYRLFMLRR